MVSGGIVPEEPRGCLQGKSNPPACSLCPRGGREGRVGALPGGWSIPLYCAILQNIIE